MSRTHLFEETEIATMQAVIRRIERKTRKLRKLPEKIRVAETHLNVSDADRKLWGDMLNDKD